MRNTFLLGTAFLLLALFLSLPTVALSGDTNQASLVVGKIKSKANKCTGGTADAIGDLLAASLSQSGKFLLASDKSIKSAKPDGSDIVIRGTVTEFDADAGSDGGGWSGLKKKAFGKAGVDSKEAKVEVKLVLVDVVSGKTVAEKKVTGSSTGWTSGMAGGVKLTGLLDKYNKEPMGKAILAVLDDMVKQVSKAVPKDYYRHAPPTDSTAKK